MNKKQEIVARQQQLDERRRMEGPQAQAPAAQDELNPQIPGQMSMLQLGDPLDMQLNQEAGRLQGMVNATDPEIRAVRNEDTEAAYQLGAKMGAQSIAQMAAVPDGSQKPAQKMTKERIIEAEKLLMRYKTGKASVDRRIINSQDWWKLRNWSQIENERGTKGSQAHKSATAWLWNCISGKHADAMDSYPEPIILPRMEEDKAEAKILSEIIPVVLQINGFEETYSECNWQKMLEGTGAYHIGWDKTKMNGIGDISITKVNMLNLFWEPGITDIQDSENLFYIRIENNDRLEQQYPQLKGKLGNAYLKPAEYRRDDNIPIDNKSVVVDWYYHSWYGPKKVLHFCQFVNEEVLYSTEDSGQMEGLYADGDYPFELDPLFPVEGSPAGYGYIDIGKDCQTDIDTINQAMVLNAVVTSTPRYFIQSDGGINEEEFSDWSKPFVHTNQMLGDNNIRAVDSKGIQGNALDMLARKIDELKFITGNTDVDNGGTPSGVTAASAIAALQERSGRTSKDSTRAGYRCYSRIVNKVIERIRQFYDIPRQFRILGANAQEQFIEYNNAKLQDQMIMGGVGMEPGLRKPVFDIDVRAQRETAYTKVAQNELAIQMLNLGVFNPQMTDQSLMMLDMMDFPGKDELMQKVESLGTIQQALMQVGQIALALAQKYQPDVANQLGMVLQGIGMDAGMAQPGGEMKTPDTAPDTASAPATPENENSRVRKTRERVANASRVQ